MGWIIFYIVGWIFIGTLICLIANEIFDFEMITFVDINLEDILAVVFWPIFLCLLLIFGLIVLFKKIILKSFEILKMDIFLP